MSYRQSRIEELEETKREFRKHLWNLQSWIQAHEIDRSDVDRTVFNADALTDMESDFIAVLDKEIAAIEEQSDDEFIADYRVDLAKGN